MNHRRIASRRVGLRRVGLGQRPRVDDGRGARVRRNGQKRMAAPSQHPVRQLGRRRAGTPRIDRMGRRPRERFEGACRDLCESRRGRRRNDVQRQRRPLADAVPVRNRQVGADRRGEGPDVIRYVARAHARTGLARSPAGGRAERRGAGIRVRLHRVSRLHRRGVCRRRPQRDGW